MIVGEPHIVACFDRVRFAFMPSTPQAINPKKPWFPFPTFGTTEQLRRGQPMAMISTREPPRKRLVNMEAQLVSEKSAPLAFSDFFSAFFCPIEGAVLKTAGRFCFRTAFPEGDSVQLRGAHFRALWRESKQAKAILRTACPNSCHYTGTKSLAPKNDLGCISLAQGILEQTFLYPLGRDESRLAVRQRIPASKLHGETTFSGTAFWAMLVGK